jgi:hypothetical protein
VLQVVTSGTQTVTKIAAGSGHGLFLKNAAQVKVCRRFEIQLGQPLSHQLK